MNDFKLTLPPEQVAIRAKCFHPSGNFVEFEDNAIEQSISERFEKIVRLYPNRIALISKDQEFTYDTLNRAANRVANAILKHGMRGNDPVPTLIQSNAATFSAAIGTWKAGKIHVALDPLLPQERVLQLLTSLEPRLVITNRRHRPLAEAVLRPGTILIDIDDFLSSITAENPGISIPPDALAWIRFTSGSSGQPKGVIQSHRNVLHYVRNFTNAFKVSFNDRVLMPHFNTTATPYYSALLVGASIYPIDITAEGLAALVRWLNSHCITIYCSNPTTFRHLLNALDDKNHLPSLRLINLDGESLSRNDVERYKSLFSDKCILVNRFGSGETGSIRAFFMDKQSKLQDSSVPIGYPLDNTQLFVLSENKNAAITNQIGELVLRGRYLSPGYWGNPAMTAKHFSTDPADETIRLYHTGDLVRLNAQGCLEHIGRKDSQLKIRGFKVEPDAVEAALMELPGIKEAAVVGRDDPTNERRLVAYIVPTVQHTTVVSALRRALLKKLPTYMVPSHFIYLDTLPLTFNGKLDRHALPSPTKSRPPLETPFVAPRNALESQLLDIWKEVLYLDELSIHDNFFDLGGHSLAAIRLISRLIKTLQIELPVSKLFESSTVADMANVICQHPERPLNGAEVDRILTELESVSDEDAKQLLQTYSKTTET